MWIVERRSFLLPEEFRTNGTVSADLTVAFGLDELFEEQYVFVFLPVRNYRFRFILQGSGVIANAFMCWLPIQAISMFLHLARPFQIHPKISGCEIKSPLCLSMRFCGSKSLRPASPATKRLLHQSKTRHQKQQSSPTIHMCQPRLQQALYDCIIVCARVGDVSRYDLSTYSTDSCH